MLFHVLIYIRGSERPEAELDIDEKDLEQRFVYPARRRKAIMINGLIVSMENLERIRIFCSTTRSGEILERVELEHADRGLPIFDQRRLAVEAITRTEEVTAAYFSEAPPPASDRRKIFLIHGRWKEAADAMRVFLRALDLDPFGWKEARLYNRREGQHNIDILDSGFEMAYAVVILMTPDDVATLHPVLSREHRENAFGGQPRPNVLFEAGYAWHAIRERTLIVEFGELNKLSNLSGVDRVRFDGSALARSEIADRLKNNIGAAVKTEGGDYLHAGNFPAPLPDPSDHWKTNSSASRVLESNSIRRGLLTALFRMSQSRQRKNEHRE